MKLEKKRFTNKYRGGVFIVGGEFDTNMLVGTLIHQIAQDL